jgi:hypothetical protein
MKAWASNCGQTLGGFSTNYKPILAYMDLEKECQQRYRLCRLIQTLLHCFPPFPKFSLSNLLFFQIITQRQGESLLLFPTPIHFLLFSATFFYTQEPNANMCRCFKPQTQVMLIISHSYR